MCAWVTVVLAACGGGGGKSGGSGHLGGAGGNTFSFDDHAQYLLYVGSGTLTLSIDGWPQQLQDSYLDASDCQSAQVSLKQAEVDTAGWPAAVENPMQVTEKAVQAAIDACTASLGSQDYSAIAPAVTEADSDLKATQDAFAKCQPSDTDVTEYRC